MNNIKISGIISKKWYGGNAGRPVNIYLTDDTYRGPVKFHVAFWNDKDYATVNSLNPGDEISFIGIINSVSPSYGVIDVYPEKIISVSHVTKDIEYISDSGEINAMIEDCTSLSSKNGVTE